MEKIKLFCIPYAGGNSLVYKSWEKLFEQHVELCPIELSGRGRRSREPLYHNFNKAVEDIYATIQEQIDAGPYAFFGHSMGGQLAYELTKKIEKNNKRLPLHLFLSAADLPHLKDEKKQYHKMNDDEFMDEIIQLGGTPKQVLEHKELLAYFLPLLKSDFTILELREITEQEKPLNIDFSIFAGKYDDMVIGDMVGWKEYTEGNCEVYEFEGSHFFLLDFYKEIIEKIHQKLSID